VDDAALVGGVHGPGQGLDQPRRLVRRQGRAAQLLLQRPAGTELQREEGQALDLADLEDLHDVGVLQTRHRLGLGVEASALVLVGVVGAEHHLEGDDAVGLDLPGLVDDAHAAAAQLPQHLVAGDVDLVSRRRRPLLRAQGGRVGHHRRRGDSAFAGQHLAQQRLVAGEARQVVPQRGLLTELPAVGHVEAKQLAQEHGAGPALGLAQERFGPGMQPGGTGLPGGLEAIAELFDPHRL
jgi:hypothetical protein